MVRHCLFAYTPPGAAPAYLSINREADGAITIMVRSEDAPNGSPGHGSIRVPDDELGKLALALTSYATDHPTAE